jgi:Uncharacterized conserved protein (DUF2285)/Family of unknown function (DUF6499)
MPHVRMRGTAWDRCREDYAYTREFDLTGWAWEFLRHNKDYRRDFRMYRAGHPCAINHVSGATVFRLRPRFLAAEAWGLVVFSDPERPALEASVFWLPELLHHVAFCDCQPEIDQSAEVLGLSSFRARRTVLIGIHGEHIALHGTGSTSNLLVNSGTLLFGESAITFRHKGLATASPHYETVKILKRLTVEPSKTEVKTHVLNSKYLNYLIALEGHLEGRSYRDIALVLFGQDAVGTHWTNDTRGYKSAARRAVAAGIELMNQGYRNLL